MVEYVRLAALRDTELGQIEANDTSGIGELEPVQKQEATHEGPSKEFETNEINNALSNDHEVTQGKKNFPLERNEA